MSSYLQFFFYFGVGGAGVRQPPPPLGGGPGFSTRSKSTSWMLSSLNITKNLIHMCSIYPRVLRTNLHQASLLDCKNADLQELFANNFSMKLIQTDRLVWFGRRWADAYTDGRINGLTGTKMLYVGIKIRYKVKNRHKILITVRASAILRFLHQGRIRQLHTKRDLQILRAQTLAVLRWTALLFQSSSETRGVYLTYTVPHN